MLNAPDFDGSVWKARDTFSQSFPVSRMAFSFHFLRRYSDKMNWLKKWMPDDHRFDIKCSSNVYVKKMKFCKAF